MTAKDRARVHTMRLHGPLGYMGASAGPVDADGSIRFPTPREEPPPKIVKCALCGEKKPEECRFKGKSICSDCEGELKLKYEGEWWE